MEAGVCGVWMCGVWRYEGEGVRYLYMNGIVGVDISKDIDGGLLCGWLWSW